MNRLLIANRGEIAVRIIRACREMGVAPLVVYSEADRHALHVGLAEEAYCIGAAPARDSYLNIPNLLGAAKQLKADAIHPGYGFLSENADFALACEQAGLVFVGPPSSVIRLLGDKIAAKQLMRDAGVPVVPGYYGNEQSDARLQAEAAQMELPLLVKAAGGGGGRGMRVVTRREQLADAIDEARREAQAAFGDERLLLERYVARPRHIEVQIFGDAQGHVVHLFERECSIQRRHQKILEESPSPILTPELRARITDAAVTAGRAAGYVNAGTVEFLLETRQNGEPAFYFLEVNTRLQVEHPSRKRLRDWIWYACNCKSRMAPPCRSRRRSCASPDTPLKRGFTPKTQQKDFCPPSAFWRSGRNRPARVSAWMRASNAAAMFRRITTRCWRN